jgi:hypothetical protein
MIKRKGFAMGLYAKWNGGERELGSRETGECVRGRASEKEGSSISTKIIIFT